MLNIPRYIEDSFYRYKMPSLKVKHEGNGHRTKITNIKDVAQSLRVPYAILLKFIGYELACQLKLDQEIFKGFHSETRILGCLDKFIDKYVLCSNCKYPELVLKIKEGVLVGSCNACGKVSKLDNSHKVIKFVLKYPLTNLSEIASNPRDHHPPNNPPSTDEEQEEEKKDFDDEKKNPTKSFFDIEDGLIEALRTYYKQFSEEIDDFDTVEIVNAAKETVPKEFEGKISYLLFNAIFDMNIAKNIAKNEILLKRIWKELKSKNIEIDLLLNLEVFLFEKNSSVDFEKYIPTILKLFYDAKLLNEEFLINWKEDKLTEKLTKDFRYEKTLNEKLKTAASPFLGWLISAEESEDDEEGEEEESN